MLKQYFPIQDILTKVEPDEVHVLLLKSGKDGELFISGRHPCFEYAIDKCHKYKKKSLSIDERKRIQNLREQNPISDVDCKRNYALFYPRAFRTAQTRPCAQSLDLFLLKV